MIKIIIKKKLPVSFIVKINAHRLTPSPPASASVMESIGTFKVLICRHGKLTGTVKVRCCKNKKYSRDSCIGKLDQSRGDSPVGRRPNCTTDADTPLKWHRWPHVWLYWHTLEERDFGAELMTTVFVEQPLATRMDIPTRSTRLSHRQSWQI